MEYIPLLANIIMAAALVIGIILTLIGLPGNFFILIIAALYGWQENFLHISYTVLAVLIVMWGSGEILEFLAGIRGVKKEKASKWAMLAAFAGSIAGGIAGTGILPLIGTVLGAVLFGFIASYAVEYMYTKDKIKAQQVAKGVLKGQLWGMMIKFVIAVSMAGTIVYKLWF